MRAIATICVVSAVTVFLASGVDARSSAVERDHEGVAIAASAAAAFPPTLDDIQINVFTPSCALSFCHGAAMQAGLHLEAGFSYDSLVNVPALEDPTRFRVEPFDPDNSFLICKLEACPTIVGQQMPLVGGPLPQATIDIIREWISLGAPDGGSVAVETQTWGSVKSLYR
jgi:hypothetical protein